MQTLQTPQALPSQAKGKAIGKSAGGAALHGGKRTPGAAGALLALEPSRFSWQCVWNGDVHIEWTLLRRRIREALADAFKAKPDASARLGAPRPIAKRKGARSGPRNLASGA